MRARLGTDSHFCEVVVLKLTTTEQVQLQYLNRVYPDQGPAAATRVTSSEAGWTRAL